MHSNNSTYKTIATVVAKLHTLFLHQCDEKHIDNKLTMRLAESLLRWVSCERHHGLKRYKAMSNFLIRYLMGNPVTIDVSSSNRRLISKVLHLIEESNSIHVKIYWVSVFSLFRLIILPPVYDVTTITSGFSGRWRDIISLFDTDILTKVKRSFSIREKWNTKWEWFISGKAGPNGMSYSTYLDDLKALKSTPAILLGLTILYYTLPLDSKSEAAKTIRTALFHAWNAEEITGNNHSRLIFFGDKGGKTRVVAIVDILTQSFLKAIHTRCFKILRHLEQDGTFDQDQARNWIREKCRLNEPMASIDLTAATDRMPALFQMFVMCHLRILTPLQAIGWYLVSTWRDFEYKERKFLRSKFVYKTIKFKGKKRKKKFKSKVFVENLKHARYQVGQPMGTLSSWPIMALSHHWLVRYAYIYTDPVCTHHYPYRVLGDDLTLIGNDVAGTYIKLISALGMDYSKEKTIISLGAAEFAKSYFCKTEVLTPFPVALLKFRYNTVVSDVFAIIKECRKRKMSLTVSSLLGFYPKKWQNTVLLAALSLPDSGYVLDLRPRTELSVFQLYLYANKINYFAKFETLRETTSLFVSKDPANLYKGFYISPFLQIARKNSASYCVTTLGDDRRNITPIVIVGSNWVSFCTLAWPLGIPPEVSDKLIPGPAWKDRKDSKIFSSSLTKFEKLIPGYFYTRCVGYPAGYTAFNAYNLALPVGKNIVILRK